MRKVANNPGIYRKCTKTCPEKGCKVHSGYVVYIDMGANADGKRIQYTKAPFKTLQDAKDHRVEVLLKHGMGAFVYDRKRTVAEYLDEWLPTLAATGRRPATVANYTTLAKTYLRPYLGHLKLTELEAGHVRKAYADIRAAKPKLSPTTIKRVNAVLCAALTQAMEDKLVERNVAQKLRLASADNPKIIPWTPAEFAAFMDPIKAKRLYPLLYVAGIHGLRRGELCGLRWSDVNLEDGYLKVNQQAVQVGREIVVGPPKTDAGAGRIVDLDADTVTLLKRHRIAQRADRMAHGSAWQDSDNRVFTAEAGAPWQPERVSKTFSRYVRASNVPTLHFHGLRHFSASIQLEAGVPLEVISKRHGHSSVAITADVYGHLSRNLGAESAEKTAALLRKVAGESSLVLS
ncbi:tyrosine-type recombinase/integrase [Smaragdicoccus niigatensis]|uniref:tyrosine-type recombinase/integrase n=1 Tax=Smaragdicoccus niigatensis TaxID=359359 RepID=UPI0003723FAA|nr:site-specific integrase [Smaragdicoccus niigatensis]